MDYEKLHKDTINKLQQMVNSGKITVEVARGICADFVPESEDERIRKCLIAIITDFESLYLQENYSLSREEALAWLEKQKDMEAKLIISDEGYNKAFQDGIEEVLTNPHKYGIEKQGKEKLLNNDKYQTVPVKILDRLYESEKELERLKQGEQKPFEMISPEESLGVSSETYNKIIDECIYGEQKPAELPKCEDYGIDGLYNAIRILEETLGKVDGYQTDDGILEHKCAISAVKNLYEQKPVWSEEDEMMLNKLLAIVALYYGYCGNVLDKQSCTSFLKSLKERYTWKPSDEQMNILKQWLKDNQYKGDARYCYPIFELLYQDLKKLKG